MRFRLLRYFSIASAFAVIAVTAVLVFAFDKYATQSLLDSVERQNVLLALFVANDLRERMPEHFATKFHHATELSERHHVGHITEIDAVLKKQLKGLPVLKVRVFHGDLTIYSTNGHDIGDSETSAEFRSVRDIDIPTSKLVWRAAFSAIGETVSDRDIVESYVPVATLGPMADKTSRSVVEISTDVTPMVARIERNSAILIAGLIILFGVLYGILILIVRRADRVIDYQYDELERENVERRSAQEALQESESRFRQLVEQAVDAFFLHDMDGRLIDVNRQACDSLGYTRNELLEMSVTDIEVAHPPEPLETRLDEMEVGTAVILDASHRRKDGSTFPVEVHVGVIDSGGRKLALALARDVTERHEAERKLEQVQVLAQAWKMEALGTMVRGLTHNFNNLLLPILSLSSLTKGMLPQGSKERQHLEKVVEASNEAKDLVNRIMMFVRNDPPDKRIIDIRAAVESSLGLARSLIPSSIELEEHLEIDAGEILADETQIHSVFLNLISNAVDAIDGNIGQILVSLRRVADSDAAKGVISELEAGEYAKLTIADNGIGMDESIVQNIFDPFFTTKKIGKGTGLGLSSAYGIIVEHGGTIRTSSTPGDGSTFEIFLPLVLNEPAPLGEKQL